jgi:hypothetical protein
MGARPPVGPLPTYAHRCEVQDASPRTRRCLLKHCEQPFHPAHPMRRYCSPSCQHDARLWSQWRANQNYRASEHGKERRRQQSQRNRQRRSQGPPEDATQPATRIPLLGGEGYQQQDSEKRSPCHRPGCYECFAIPLRSPLKKFCSTLCRRALRAVLQREARWRRRRHMEGTSRAQHFTRPP